MARSPSLDALRLEIEADPVGLVNLVANPSGELGGWGWVTPVAGGTLAGVTTVDGRRLRYTSPGVVSDFLTEPLPIIGGDYAAASWVVSAAVGEYVARFDWLDANRDLISSTPDTTAAGADPATVAYGPHQAPALATFVQLRLEHRSLGGGAPAAGATVDVHGVTVASDPDPAELGTLRVNRMANPSFETDLEGWDGYEGCLIARQAADAMQGAACLEITPTANTCRVRSSRVEVEGGASFTVSAWARHVDAEGDAALSLYPIWYDEAGAALATGAALESGTVRWGVAGNTWQRISGTWAAPSGATWAVLEVKGTGLDLDQFSGRPAPGWGWWSLGRVDGVLWEKGTTLGGYFDGDTVAAGFTYSTTSSTVAIPAEWYDTIHNLITNPSLELHQRSTGYPADTRWKSWNAQIAAGEDGRDADRKTVGAFSGKVVGNNTQNFILWGSPEFPVVGGQNYRVAVDLWLAVSGAMEGNNKVSIGLIWSETPGISMITQNGAARTFTNVPVLQFERHVYAPYVPAGMNYAAIYLRVENTSGNNILDVHKFYFDAAMASATPYDWEYFDGDTPDSLITADYVTTETVHTWDGAAHLSASTRTITRTREIVQHQEISSTLAYIEPRQYVDVLGPSHEIKVVRAGLDLGTLTATVLDTSLDPATATLIRPGRVARLMLDTGDGVEPIITARIREADVEYDLLARDPRKVARIAISAGDAIAELANTSRPQGVREVDELPWVLEGAGVPWNVNGSGDQVDTAGIVSNNEAASVVDQVAITRDTALGYAWVDQRGVLNAWDRAAMEARDPASPPVLDEDDYSALDVAFSTSSAINEVRVTLLTMDTDGATSETALGPWRDEQSIATWGVYSREVTVHGLSVAEVETLAASILAANATPRARVVGVTVPIRSAADLTTSKALLDLYDLIIPSNTDRGLSDRLRVTTLEHTITPARWTMTLRTDDEAGVASPAIAPPVQSGVSIGGPVPVGGVIMHGAAATVPAGWLECDGSLHDPAAFPDLFAILGTTHGGDGIATFGVPNLTDRFPIGAGAKAVGSSGGASTVTITDAHLPPHTHPMPRRGNTGSHATGVAQGGSATADNSDTGNGGFANQALDVLNPWRALTFLIRAT